MSKTIVHYSISGNTRAFAKRFQNDGYTTLSIKEAEDIEKPFILFTPTYNFGRIPAPITRYLEKKEVYLRGVVSFGDRGWGDMFATAGDLISQKYNVPLIAKVEKRGTSQDYLKIRRELHDRFRN